MQHILGKNNVHTCTQQGHTRRNKYSFPVLDRVSDTISLLVKKISQCIVSISNIYQDVLKIFQTCFKNSIIYICCVNIYLSIILREHGILSNCAPVSLLILNYCTK